MYFHDIGNPSTKNDSISDCFECFLGGAEVINDFYLLAQMVDIWLMGRIARHSRCASVVRTLVSNKDHCIASDLATLIQSLSYWSGEVLCSNHSVRK